MSVFSNLGNTIATTATHVGAWFTSQFTPSKLQADVHEVQALCVATCGFLPVAETVAGVFLAAAPELRVATLVADGVCAAINAGVTQTASGQTTINPTVKTGLITLDELVHGKPVVGSFIAK